MNASLTGAPASAAAAAVLAAAQAQPHQYLNFVLKGRSYAVPIDSVREILEFGGLTDVPMMPAFVRGVMNLRGAVVPVIDLSARFQQGNCDIARRTCIVIFETQRGGTRQTLGVLVDGVNAVLEIPAEDVEAAPRVGAYAQPEFIRGMAKIGARLIVLLDLDGVLAETDLAALAGTQS